MGNYNIAIVGMGCIFPKANSIDQYWKNIQSGDSYVTKMPRHLWYLDNFYSPERSLPEKSYTTLGSFIEGFEFPFLEYRLPPNALRGVDPCQLITLEATKQALLDAGIEPRSEQLVDACTVVGASGVDGFAHCTMFLKRRHYFERLRPLLEQQGIPAADIDRLFEEFTTELSNRGHDWNASIAAVGAIPSSVSNRVAQVFGIKGYNMTVDAACASSFVAIDVGCQALMAGDVRVAVAGGADLGTNPAIYIGFSRVDGLSLTGHSNPFDHTADGLIIGEGVGMVVLKRLEDALADGDRIRAVIRGIGSSSDGAGQAIYAPSVEGRAEALRRGLDKSGIEPHEVQFIEAHATSTIVGDANEYDAIAQVYAPGRDTGDPVHLGSVKHQIGHLKAAAGVAGLLKTVLGMQNGTFPHLPRFTQLTPGAQNPTAALNIPTELLPWEPRESGMRVGAVTTSGFGGVNYHLILEQGDSYAAPAERASPSRQMAIVGVSVRVAGADSVDAFWQNVTTGADVFTEVDAGKLGWEDHIDTGPENERITTRAVSQIADYELKLLKHKIFPNAVSQIAPTQFLALDLADRLLEQAGLDLRSRKNIAVSLGAMHDDYFPTIFIPMAVDEYADTIRCCPVAGSLDPVVLEMCTAQASETVKRDFPPVTEHTLPGWMTNVTAGRLANKFNLSGPNFTVDTACSSGLAALLPAMYQLMFGDVDMVITGGLNRQLSAEFTSGVCALGAVAVDTARPFDEQGKGFLIGEGGIFYLLKRLEDAERDGDDIMAVLHNVSGSSEADSKTMVAPTEAAVRRSIKNAMSGTSIPPESIGVVDTHGSANLLSDLAEARALAAELRGDNGGQPVQITAIKSHIGHLYGGSGASSLLSSIQALRTGEVPGIRLLDVVRPELAELAGRVEPRKGTVPLPAYATAGAANSLGLGGANYFAVVTAEARQDVGAAEAEPLPVPPAGNGHAEVRADDSESTQIFVCVAANEQSLSLALTRSLQKSPIPTFVSEGSAATLRMAATFENEGDLRNKLNGVLRMLAAGHNLRVLESQGIYLAKTSPGSRPERLAFCFPGQGVHYIGMGRHLYEQNPIFRKTVDRVHAAAKKTFKFDLLGHIYGPDDPEARKGLGTLVGGQTALFAIEIALARMLTTMGVKPDVMIGHSFGEISALTVAGVWDIETALKVVEARIKSAELIIRGKGPRLGMASVICSPDQRDAILDLTGGSVVLSNVNAPNRFVFAGGADAIERTVKVAETFGANARILPIGAAFHSHFMEPAREPFRKALRRLPCSPPSIPVLSTITGEYVEPDQVSSAWLSRHLSNQFTTKLNLVREISRLHKEGLRNFLEVGPGWSMTNMIKAILEGATFRAVPCLHPKVGDEETYRRALAFLMAFGRLPSAADRRNLPGIFTPDFLGYVQYREPAVLSLMYEVHRRYLQEIQAGKGPEELRQAAPPPPAPPAMAVAPPQDRRTAVAPPPKPAPAEAAAPGAPAAVGDAEAAVWIGRLKEKLVETTGYPEEMLEEHLDLEADLGVDSVQRAEIWVALTREHGLDEDSRPEGPRTIENIARNLAALAAGPVAASAKAGASAEPAASAAAADGPSESIWHLFAPCSRLLDDSDAPEPFDCRKLLAVMGPKKGWATKTFKSLADRGIEVTTVAADELAGMSGRSIAGLLKGCDTLIYVAHRNLCEVGPEGSSLRKAFQVEYRRLFAAFQALLPALQRHPLRILVPVTQDGTFGTTAGTNRLLGSFPAGFVRSLKHELPDCRFQLIDTGETRWGQALGQQIDTLGSKLELGMTHLGLTTPVLARVVTPAARRVSTLSKGDLVLVTGGARGIVFECVLALAEATGCRLLLTGRTHLPEGSPDWLNAAPEEIDTVIRNVEIDLVRYEKLGIGEARRKAAMARTQWELSYNLGRVESAGVSVRYEVCDVCDADALSALVARVSQEDDIVGIVHGAGVQRSHLLAELIPEQVELTVNTKLDPLFTLLDTVDWSKCRLLSAFGSIAGLFGNVGQTDYALANDLLTWAVKGIGSLYPHIHCQTIEWTAWSGTGMVTDAEAKRFSEAGLIPVDVKHGVAMYLDGVLGASHTQLAAFNPSSAFASGRQISEHPVAARPRVALVDEPDGDAAAFATLSLERDVYLNQHLVNGEPVVPGTFVTEIFAEATSRGKQALKEVRFRRPLSLRQESLRVEVVREGKTLLLVPAERPDLGDKGLTNLSYASCRLCKKKEGESARLEFSDKELKALRAAARTSTLPFYTLLDEKFSHALKTGPVFRGILATIEKGDYFYSLVTLTDEAVAQIEIPGRFVINPVLADMAVQVASAWSMQTHNVMAIPFEFGTLNVAGKTSGREAVVICRSIESTPEHMVVDVAVREPDGSLVFSVDRMVLKTIARLDSGRESN